MVKSPRALITWLEDAVKGRCSTSPPPHRNDCSDSFCPWLCSVKCNATLRKRRATLHTRLVEGEGERRLKEYTVQGKTEILPSFCPSIFMQRTAMMPMSHLHTNHYVQWFLIQTCVFTNFWTRFLFFTCMSSLSRDSNNFFVFSLPSFIF